MEIKSLIRTIENFPKPGIMFRDMTTLFRDSDGLQSVIQQLTTIYRSIPIDYIAGIESRGFILGAAMALEMKKGFIPIRKKGKLPGATFKQEYALEYGTDALEIHKDALEEGQKILIVDDLLATGGTLMAAKKLIELAGGNVVGAAVVVDLPGLKGSELLKNDGVKVHSLVTF